MTGPTKFNKADAVWLEETVWFYQNAGFLRTVPSEPRGKLVDTVVKAFTKRFGRVPVWNTPFENQRLLILDEANVIFEPLLDLDRAPPLRGLYTKTLGRLAHISFKSFPLKNIRETWATDGNSLTVTGTLGKKSIRFVPRFVRHGQFDLDLINQINKLLPRSGRRFEVYKNDGADDQTLIVSIDARYRRGFEVQRQWKFVGRDDWKRMLQVFRERERAEL